MYQEQDRSFNNVSNLQKKPEARSILSIFYVLYISVQCALTQRYRGLVFYMIIIYCKKFIVRRNHSMYCIDVGVLYKSTIPYQKANLFELFIAEKNMFWNIYINLQSVSNIAKAYIHKLSIYALIICSYFSEI